jgi:hypothetical protein
MTHPSIISLEDEEDFVNLLVYGKSGVGKTVWAGSAEGVLFIAPEDDGTISAKRRGSKAKKWKVKSWDDLMEALEWLEDNEDHGFEVICIDSITHMQQILLRHILQIVVEEKPDRDLDIPAIQDHQKWQNMFKRFVLRFNALPVNVVWTALVRNETDEEGQDFLTPDIQGKGYQMSQTICSYMTSYGCLQAKRVKNKTAKEGEPEYRIVRGITWEDTGVVQGKDRTGVLAPKTTGKSLQQVLDMIFPPAGGKTTTRAPRNGAVKVKSTRVSTSTAVEKVEA